MVFQNGEGCQRGRGHLESPRKRWLSSDLRKDQGERGEGSNWAEGVICSVALGLGRQVAGAGRGGGWIVLAKIVFIL